MNKSLTQFSVALASVLLVGIVCMMLVWGAIFEDVDMAVAMASFSGLTGIAGTAATWLFRVNNSARH